MPNVASLGPLPVSLFLVVASLLSTPCSSAHDLYAVLGVDKGASYDEISSAHSRLATLYDPTDIPEIRPKYEEIIHAFRVLNNPAARNHYDQFGVVMENPPPSSPPPAPSPPPPPEPSQQDKQMARSKSEQASAKQRQGNLRGAAVDIDEAVRLNPIDFTLHFKRGIIYDRMDARQAIQSYRRALELEPESLQVANNLGNTLKNTGDFDGALDVLKKCTKLVEKKKANFFQCHFNLGHLQERHGFIDEAIAAFTKSLKYRPDDGLEVYKSLLLPYQYDSMASLQKWRNKFINNIEKLRNRRPRLNIPHPNKMQGVPQYYLAYHGEIATEVHRSIAAMMSDATPSMANFKAPHLATWQPPRATGRRVRVGLGSHYFRKHSVTDMLRGWFFHMPREGLEIFVYSWSNGDDAATHQLKPLVDHYTFIDLHQDLEKTRQTIAKDALDVFIFPEIGMDPTAYSLGFSRLAHRQIAMHGHADTTGLPNVDYYVSYDGFHEGEYSVAQTKYSETLLRLPGVTMLTLSYSIQPFRSKNVGNEEARARLRRKYNIHSSATVYAMMQTLFKVTPHLDPVYKAILDTDPNAIIVFKDLMWTKRTSPKLTSRLNKSLGESARRVVIIPPVNDNDYVDLFSLFDVILDSYPFGGHTSSMDAFSNDLPVVTLPSGLMSGSCTLGFIRAMDKATGGTALEQALVATDYESMARKATALAMSKDLMAQTRGLIRQGYPDLVNDKTSVNAWAELLHAVGNDDDLTKFKQ